MRKNQLLTTKRPGRPKGSGLKNALRGSWAESFRQEVALALRHAGAHQCDLVLDRELEVDESEWLKERLSRRGRPIAIEDAITILRGLERLVVRIKDDQIRDDLVCAVGYQTTANPGLLYWVDPPPPGAGGVDIELTSVAIAETVGKHVAHSIMPVLTSHVRRSALNALKIEISSRAAAALARVFGSKGFLGAAALRQTWTSTRASRRALKEWERRHEPRFLKLVYSGPGKP